jgi:hypothetical protein
MLSALSWSGMKMMILVFSDLLRDVVLRAVWGANPAPRAAAEAAKNCRREKESSTMTDTSPFNS